MRNNFFLLFTDIDFTVLPMEEGLFALTCRYFKMCVLSGIMLP